ncbi:PqqD family protein [Candidatus Aminicenantes bacterium AC-335-A11]|nr:PqqD family protein [SCandidatus Aminicenantes bacterium Aminicenantia_JdfR_composite]MCP2596961.1 PqqD family protein [Candidatus Aminicenantes bacterium AC-335-G13]MCP2605947.1 PqqD family protein [Candidatus Aminicenantes bacterium AC-708-I09]MCP2618286.1 PqqD family protein [Candidatus Aminicenantes bacterium AC-335-A11]
MKKKENTNINFLDLVPVRNIEWERGEGGLIVLLKPKFKNKFIVKYFLPKMKKPFFRIRLDEIGSYVWELCNEENTVSEIGIKLKERFGEKIEPVYDRLIIFLKQLERGKCIKFKLRGGREHSAP